VFGAGLEFRRRLGVGHHRVHAGSDLLHLGDVGVLERVHHLLGGTFLWGQHLEGGPHPAGEIGPAVLDQVLEFVVHPHPGERLPVGREVVEPPLLPARRRDLGEPPRVERAVVADVDRRRGPLEHVQLLAGPSQLGHALDRRRPGPDDRDPLVGQTVHRRPLGAATGVGVVPSAGVEGVAGEVLDALDARQLLHLQGTGPDPDEPGGEVVAAVGADPPAGAGLVPGEVGDLGVEEGVVVETELLADPATVLEDLGAVGVLLGRHVAGLLEERHVDHRGGVTHDPGVAVPVPGTPEVPRLVDDPDVVDARLLQSGADQQAGETPADEGEGDVVVHRLPIDHLGVGVFGVVGEPPGEADVLIEAVGAQPLVPLLGVPPQDGPFVVRGDGHRAVLSFFSIRSSGGSGPGPSAQRRPFHSSRRSPAGSSSLRCAPPNTRTRREPEA
jgi:hypothetical protein